MTFLEEARSWLAHSGEALSAARDNLMMGYRGVAVNRAYYAAFYAACCVMAACRGRFPKTHAGPVQQFGEVAVLGSDFPPDVAKSLGVLAAIREKSDYDMGYAAGLDSDDVAGLIETAALFCSEVSNWLERHYQD